MGKTVYELYKVKINIFLNLTSFLVLKKSKNTFYPVASFKRVKQKIWLILDSPIFQRPCDQGKRQH